MLTEGGTLRNHWCQAFKMADHPICQSITDEKSKWYPPLAEILTAANYSTKTTATWGAMFGLPTFVIHCTLAVFSTRVRYQCLLIYCCNVVYGLCTNVALQLRYYDYLHHFHYHNSFLASWKTCSLSKLFRFLFSVFPKTTATFILVFLWYSLPLYVKVAHPAQCFYFFFDCVGFGNSPPPFFLYILTAVLITFLSMTFIMCNSLTFSSWFNG